jgi:FkbM family methyltransferase
MADILNDYKVLDIWEKETTAIVERDVKRGDVCVDVGASQGYFAMLFARLVGKTGKVVAIEPTDFQQPYLRKNIRKNGYKGIIKLVHCGAWDKDEVVAMPLSAPEYCQFKLRCRPVDDILEELGIWNIDFIKIDADGPEPKILKGMTRTIERSPKMKMVIEFYPKYIEDGGCSVQEFKDTIDKYFDVHIIPDDYTEGCWNLYCTRKKYV